MANKYTVTWIIEVESDGDHKAAAQAVASRYFKEHIAAGQYDSACSFTVAGPVGVPVEIDLTDSLSDLEGDDTE